MAQYSLQVKMMRSHGGALVGAALAMLLVGCHDASRNNPLDPTLTPAVELSVALEETSGAAILRWTPYAGTADFAGYVVRRNLAQTTLVDTVHATSDLQQTTYRDTTLRPDGLYEYTVLAVNSSGYAASSNLASVSSFTTRAIELLPVTLEPDRGAAHLRWTQYRLPRFSSYEVRRQAAGTDLVERLADIRTPADTTFTDTSLLADFPYLYTVASTAAGQTHTSNVAEATLRLPPVRLVSAEVTSRTASATLSWTAYTGARFRSYQIWRAHGNSLEMRHQGEQATFTSFVDTNLIGNTPYTYEVRTLTQRGELSVSNPRGVVLHPHVDTWDLPATPGEYVRLYAHDADQILVLVASRESVRFLDTHSNGQVRAQHTIMSLSAPSLEPRAVSIAWDAEGRRWLGLASGLEMADTWLSGVWGLDSEWRPVMLTEKLGEVGAAAFTEVSRACLRLGQATVVSNMALWGDGDSLLDLDFAVDEPETGWSLNLYSPPMGRIAPRFRDGLLLTNDGTASTAAFLVEARHVRAQISVRSPVIGGQSSSARCELVVHSGKVYNSKSELASVLVGIESDGMVYRGWWGYHTDAGIPDSDTRIPSMLGQRTDIVLEAGDGWLRSQVAHPWQWYRLWDQPVGSAVAVGVGEHIGFLAGGHGLTSLQGEDAQTPRALVGHVTDARSWHRPDDPWPSVGICSSESNTVYYFSTIQSSDKIDWVHPNSSQHLGTGMGSGAGELLAPVSFDVTEDGRFVVVDAGNDRIQVFDADGNYLTQWGSVGSGEGAFEFGIGRTSDDVSGSVCVDQNGYIYVADVHNGRIQVFAP
jgi:hypothetical protein